MTVNMSDANFSVSVEKEACLKKLKRNLDRWREVVLFVHSVLIWKKKAYPWIIFAVTTFVFAEIAYYEMSVVTIASLLLLTFTVTDFLAPMLVNSFVRDEWTASKQKELEEICRTLAHVVVAGRVYYASLQEVKTLRPNLYYPVAVATLCLLAYVGNSVNNLFISYAIVLALLMTPGLVHLGILQKYYRSVMSQEFVKNFSKPKSQ